MLYIWVYNQDASLFNTCFGQCHSYGNVFEKLIKSQVLTDFVILPPNTSKLSLHQHNIPYSTNIFAFTVCDGHFGNVNSEMYHLL